MGIECRRSAVFQSSSTPGTSPSPNGGQHHCPHFAHNLVKAVRYRVEVVEEGLA